LLTQVKALLEYRRTSNKVLEQRYCEEIQLVNSECIGLLWKEPLTKLYGYLDGSIYSAIRQRQKGFVKECTDRIMSVRNLAKFDQESRMVCTTMLESLVNLVTLWSNLLLEEGRHDLIDRFVNE
jgi:hypothetical protein